MLFCYKECNKCYILRFYERKYCAKTSSKLAIANQILSTYFFNFIFFFVCLQLTNITQITNLLANYNSYLCNLDFKFNKMEEWAQKLSEHIWKSPIKDIQTFDTDPRPSRAWLFLLKIKHIFFNKKYTKLKSS